MAVFAERIAAMGTENAFKIGDDIAKLLSEIDAQVYEKLLILRSQS